MEKINNIYNKTLAIIKNDYKKVKNLLVKKLAPNSNCFYEDFK
jgi:hypothetical protein